MKYKVISAQEALASSRTPSRKIVEIVTEFVTLDAEAIEIEYTKQEYTKVSRCASVFRQAVKRLGLSETIMVTQRADRVFLVKRVCTV